MSDTNFLQLWRHANSNTNIIVVHLETVNHCRQSRDQLRQTLEDQGISNRVHIPADGESIRLGT
jgi:hypothetical protein